MGELSVRSDATKAGEAQWAETKQRLEETILDLQTERDLAVEKAVALTRRVRSLEAENRELAAAVDGTQSRMTPSSGTSGLQNVLAPKDKSAMLELTVDPT